MCIVLSTAMYTHAVPTESLLDGEAVKCHLSSKFFARDHMKYLLWEMVLWNNAQELSGPLLLIQQMGGGGGQYGRKKNAAGLILEPSDAGSLDV